MLPFKGKIKVTSGFRTPQRPNHGGIDLVGIESKEILSVTDGTVTIAAMQTGKSASYGNLVVVNYGGNRYFYAHMSKIGVKLGDKIKAGDKLGIMGATGNTTGVHLHFEVRNSKNVRIDPTSFIPPIKNEKGIYIGDTIPKKQESAVSNAVYIVQKGDTLSSIAKKHGTTWKELALINSLDNPNLIYPGQKIKITEVLTVSTAKTIRKGDKVCLRRGAKDYNGKSLAVWVFGAEFVVIEVKGDRVVIGNDREQVTAAVRLGDLC